MRKRDGLEGAMTEDEIEITPEMLEAGAEVLFSFQTATTDEEAWARRVFLAMWGRRPQLLPAAQSLAMANSSGVHGAEGRMQMPTMP